MRNPFSRHDGGDPRLHPEATQAQVDAAFTSEGWATKIEREVARTGAEPLVFRCRMPTGVNLVEVSDLVAATQGAPAWIDSATRGLQDAAEQAGAIVVGAIVTDDKPTDVFATLTVTFSEQVTDPRITIREPGPDEKVRQHVTQLTDNCTMVNRISVYRPAPDEELRGMFVVEFLWRTEYGGLIMAFTTVHSGGGSDEATHFFVQVAKDSQLVPASAPAG